MLIPNPRDWENLQGSIIIFQHGSAWNSLYSISDLHLADSSFPSDLEISAYGTNPIQLDSTPEATETIPCPNSAADPSLPLFNTMPKM